MKTFLADTSVWVNFFNRRETSASLYLQINLDYKLVATCPVILQEILQGTTNNKDFEQVKTLFDNLVHLYPGNYYNVAVQAAMLYRNLRKHGVTVRKPNDCLIACYAINNDLQLLHDDIDFEHISAYSALKLIKP